MSAHVRQVAGLFPSARRETLRYWNPLKKPIEKISQLGRGVINIVASPYYHYADKPNTGWNTGWKQLAGSAQAVAGTAIVAAYGISAFSGPRSVPLAGEASYSNLPGSIDMPYGAEYPGMTPTPPAPALPSANFPNPDLAGGSIDMPYGVNYPGADLSPSMTDTALAGGKYLAEKIGLPLTLKLLTTAPAAAGYPGGGYSVYNQAGGTDGGGSGGSPGGGGGFFSGFDQPGALGLPVWATYVIAAGVLGLAIAASKRRG